MHRRQDSRTHVCASRTGGKTTGSTATPSALSSCSPRPVGAPTKARRSRCWASYQTSGWGTSDEDHQLKLSQRRPGGPPSAACPRAAGGTPTSFLTHTESQKPPEQPFLAAGWTATEQSSPSHSMGGLLARAHQDGDKRSVRQHAPARWRPANPNRTRPAAPAVVLHVDCS